MFSLLTAVGFPCIFKNVGSFFVYYHLFFGDMLKLFIAFKITFVLYIGSLLTGLISNTSFLFMNADDGEIKFEYCEVEERCRQSFEAWQDKQKELEDQEKETLKAHRDREEKEFQEEEEKRHCWMEQFEVEKKKLENIQKVFCFCFSYIFSESVATYEEY